MRSLAILVVVACSFGCRTSANVSQQLSAESDPIGNECAFSSRMPEYSAPSQPIPSNVFRLPWDVFLSAAVASDLAYSSQAGIRATATSWGFTTVDVVEEAGLLAFVASNDRCMVVVFRGTNEIRNWLTNGQIRGRTMTVGKMHGGFFDAFGTLKTRVQNYVKWQGGRDKKIWVVGHSLGGALAGVFAYENSRAQAASRYDLEYVVTFGQPLFADTLLAPHLGELYRRRFFRIVNERDIVARVPPGYKHFGSLVWFHDAQVIFRPQLPTGSVPVAAAAAAAYPPGQEPDVDDIPEVALEPNEEEFEAFMEGYQPPQRPAGASPEPVQETEGTPPVAAAAPAAISYVEDHSMVHYIRLVSEQLGGS